ncbi:hypothetical protein RB597_004739 [Gaeumannomyces tritici]
MCDLMDIDLDEVSFSTGSQQFQSRKQQAVPACSVRSVQPINARKRAYTKKRTKNLLRLLTQPFRLVRPEAMTFFAANFESILEDWILILVKTSLPSSTPSSDPHVITAFQVLDNAIKGSDRIRSRLAHIQLLRVFKSLEDIIASERRIRGKRTAFERGNQGKRGERNVCVAHTLYKSAQPQAVSRRDLIRRKQAARCWRTLAGPLPFFLIIYSEVAESVVKNSSKIDKQTQESLAFSVLKYAPDELIKACIHLAEAAELAIKPGQLFDKRRMVAEIKQDLLGTPSEC